MTTGMEDSAGKTLTDSVTTFVYVGMVAAAAAAV